MSNQYEDEDYDEEPYEFRYENDERVRTHVGKDGKGTAVFPNQDVYTGPYKNHLRNGKGEYKFTRQSATYVGDYVDNCREGVGRMTYPDGSVYQGQWKKNKKHGHGVYTYANGDKYCGAWDEDIRSGQGTYIYAISNTQLVGEWVNGQCLDGKLSYADENLIQLHAPFSAVVKAGVVAKYNSTVSAVDRVIFQEKPEAEEAPALSVSEQALHEDEAKSVGDDILVN